METIEKYTELQNTLNELYIGRAKGSLIRSRVQHLELNEKNNKYFLNLEKRNHPMGSFTKNKKYLEKKKGTLRTYTVQTTLK